MLKRAIAWALTLGLCLSLSVCGVMAQEAPADPAIHVQLDGQELVFPDATPQLLDQRTFLPFRAVFEAMGATVDNQGDVITAVRDGKTLTMTVGSNQATVTEGDLTVPITMDVAPFVDPSTWRTYVPVRFAAQAFGCAVGWDQDAQTAIIIDTEKLVDEALAGKSFTYLEKIAAMEEKNETGAWAMDATFIGDESVGAFPAMALSCELHGIHQENQAQVDMTMKMDLADLLAAITQQSGETVPPDVQATADALAQSGVSMAIRGDLDTGKCFFQIDLGALADQSVLDPATWYQIDLDALFQTMGTDWRKLVWDLQQMDQEELVRLALSALTVDSAANSYTDLRHTVETVVTDLSDQSFVQDGDSRVSTLELGPVVLSLSVEMDGDQVTCYALDCSCHLENPGLDLSVTTTLDDQGKLGGQFAMESPGVIAAHLSFNGAYTPASAAPETAPPDGAQVVDLVELLTANMSPYDPGMGVIGGPDGPMTVMASDVSI